MDAQTMSIMISVCSLALTAGLAYVGASKGTAVRIAKLETMIDELSARVEKHNSVVERTAKLETTTAELDRRIERLEARGDR